MNNKVHVLWTGGWDSTFRIVELSFQEIDIYPVYVLDPARYSHKREIEAMHNIVDALREKPLTKATIHGIEVIERSAIPEDIEITDAFTAISSKTSLGSQHEWLARLGKIRPGMEIGTEAGSVETSRILNSINTYGEMSFENGIGFLNPEKSSKEIMLVLGWFRFPIITRTELDMLEQIKQWGYEDVMKLIWFCHIPVKGKPCGCCHPCDVKMESEMGFLLPPKAQMRYRISHGFSKIFGKRLGFHFNKILRKL